MPTFNTIDNGESGLSVRNTLNDVINYVNTGITSGGSYTYITEDTTPGSELLLISVDNGSVYSQLELNTGGGYSSFNMLQGTDTSNIDLQTTDITLQVSDGTYTSTLKLYPNEVNTNVTDGTDATTEIIIPNNYSTIITDGVKVSTIDITYDYNSLIINNGVSGVGEVAVYHNTVGINNTLYTQNIVQNTTGTTQSEVLVFCDLNNDTTQIQLQSTDGTNTSTQTQTPNSIISTSSDGTFTNTSTIDSDRTLFEITDGTIHLEADFDANNGINIAHTNGTYNASFGLDGNTGNALLISTDGTNTSTQTITPTSIVSSVTDGTNISDISNFSNQLFFTSTDGAVNSNFSLSAPAFGINVGNGTNSGVASFEASLISNNINNGTTLDNHRFEIIDTQLEISSFDTTLTSGSSVTTDLTKVDLFSSDGITTSHLYVQNDKINLIVNNEKPVVIQGIENYRVIITTSNATPTTILTIPFGSTQALQSSSNINCKVKCKNTAVTSGYTANLFAGFIWDGATVTQLSTTDKLEKSTLVGATSNISFTGTDLIISVTGLVSTNLDWVVNVEIQ
jgi:hypothetical protein